MGQSNCSGSTCSGSLHGYHLRMGFEPYYLGYKTRPKHSATKWRLNDDFTIPTSTGFVTNEGSARCFAWRSLPAGAWAAKLRRPSALNNQINFAHRTSRLTPIVCLSCQYHEPSCVMGSRGGVTCLGTGSLSSGEGSQVEVPLRRCFFMPALKCLLVGSDMHSVTQGRMRV